MSKKVFFIFFITIIISFPFLNLIESKAEKEVFFNKTLMTFNEVLNARNTDELIYRFTRYINEHSFLKKEMIELRSSLIYRFLNTTASPNILRTNEDWLFKINLDYYSPEKIKRMKHYIDNNITNYFKILKEYCKRNGIEFYLVIAPSREFIHNEKTAPYITSKTKLTPNGKSLFFDFLNNKELNIIDLHPVINSYKNDERLYNKFDIHWNGLGSYIGFEYLISRMNKEEFSLNLDEFSYRRKNKLTGIFAREIGLQNSLLDTDVEVIEDFEGKTILDNYYNDTFNFNIPKQHLPFTVKNPKKQKSVVFYHDSYGQQFSRYFGKHFQETYFISPWYHSIAKNWNHCYLNPEVLLRKKPDIFIFQLILKRLLVNLESCKPYLESLNRSN
jgi:hypothetical protein